MNMDYKYSAEYRDRFGFTRADLWMIEEAFRAYAQVMDAEIAEIEARGEVHVMTQGFIAMMGEDIVSKAKNWAREEPVYEEED